ncbi:hypothetical protein ABT336_12145 [Micromonospora sp. NPDC000207]|uniref:hypothetical protein n=1 Tax=Micromonospora sp. NPDC000207 TaxID=3154246 RepID=UPI003331051F
MTTPPADDHELWLDQLQHALDDLERDVQIAGCLTHGTAEAAVTPAIGGEPIRFLLDRSSLGTPDARALAAGTPDEVARRIVARADDIADQAWEAHAAALPCNLYWCPTSGRQECHTREHRSFDVCCDRPDLHQSVTEPVAPAE